MFFLPTERLHIMFYIGISGSAFGAEGWPPNICGATDIDEFQRDIKRQAIQICAGRTDHGECGCQRDFSAIIYDQST